MLRLLDLHLPAGQRHIGVRPGRQLVRELQRRSGLDGHNLPGDEQGRLLRLQLGLRLLWIDLQHDDPPL
jgi:hypothetical protein